MTPDAMPRVMPLFPLPNIVFFPHTHLPLHVFEPRYRQMVEDALRGDRWIAVALLAGEAAEEETTPPTCHAVAGAGRIGQYRKHADGRYNIVVEGMTRVRILEEVASKRLYRKVSVSPLPEDLTWLSEREGAEVVGRLMLAAARLGLIGSTPPTGMLPPDPTERAALVNRLASSVMAEPQERQALLDAADYRERSQLLARQLRFSTNLAEALLRNTRPEDPGLN